MRVLSFALGLMLVAAPTSWAFDEPAPKKKPPTKDTAPTKDDDEKSVADQIEAVQTEIGKKQQDLIKQYRAAKDDDERQKILQEFRGLQEEMTKQCAAIVEKHPNDEGIFPALQLLINSEHAAKATDLLLKHHLDNAKIGEICLQFAMQRTQDAERFVRTVAEKSKSDEAKGLALLALGEMLVARSNEEGLADAERDKLRKQGTETLKTVVKKYPDFEAYGRKSGDWASAVLFEAEHLSVGMPVPDLAGEDLEGEEFKLADYRGKVVFLDFWAHW